MESARRRILNTLNSRYLYGRVVSAFRLSRRHDVHDSYPSEPPREKSFPLRQPLELPETDLTLLPSPYYTLSYYLSKWPLPRD